MVVVSPPPAADPWFLVPAALSGVAAVVAMEAGWTVTEVGRQPWIVYRVMLTSSAVTPASGVVVTLAVILVLYVIMTVVSIGVPMIMSRRWLAERPADEEAEQVLLEAKRRARQDLVRYFSKRATGAGILTGALAAITFAELSRSAPYVYAGLTGRALPLVAISVAAGIAVLGMIRLRWYPGLRPAAAIAVVTVVWGWGLAQYPQLLPGALSLAAGSAPPATLLAELAIAGIAALIVGPAFGLLYSLQ